MTPQELAEVRAGVHDLAGLDPDAFGPSAVERACRTCWRSMGVDASTWVTYTRRQPAELVRVVEAMLVGETWFAREPTSFELLQRHLAGRQRTGGVVRMLSIGCATGEEAWTLAAAAAAVAPLRQVRVRAMDFSRASLEQAATRRYGARSVRGPLPLWLSPYLRRDGKGWVVSEALASSVQFGRRNAIHLEPTGDKPATAQWDAVFCRNMLLYLSAEARLRVINAMVAATRPGGLIVVAAAESRLLARRGLDPVKAGQPVFQVGRTLNSSSSLSDPRKPTPRERRRTRDRVTTRAPVDTVTLHSARMALDRGETIEAERICRRHLARSGPDADAYHLIGEALLARGESRRAVAFWRRATFLQPDHVAALQALADAAPETAPERRRDAIRRRAADAADKADEEPR